VAIGPAGVRIGRHAGLEIVLNHPEVSRQHGLLRATAAGVQYIPLGRAPTHINGRVVAEPCLLTDHDRLAIADTEFTLEIGPEVRDEESTWMLAASDGASYGIPRFPYVVGGAASDAIVIPGWPPSAMRLRGGPAGLTAELVGLSLNDDVLDRRVTVELGAGDRLSCAGVALEVRQVTGRAEEATLLPALAGPATRCELAFLERGGVLTLEVGSRTFCVPLVDSRCDLVAALLRPNPPFVPGDFVPDEVLTTAIWGAASGRARTDINLLLHRVRRDLSDAGMAAMTFLQRGPGGGATRFHLAPGASVRVS
jgi:pSer/pThr/pTyr-binding forkhead associated (FHA) protein